MSRDYVGDMAETVSLLWPASAEGEPELDDGTVRISDAVERLRWHSRADAPRVLANMLDHLDASGRFALLKLATGALRVGISARLAKQALADAFGLDVEQVEEVWHGLKPPYHRAIRLGRKAAARSRLRETCRCSGRSCSLIRWKTAKVSLDDYAAEWKWDGIRVQLVHAGGQTRLYSRTGDDISGSFPDVAELFQRAAVLDGELLVRGADQGGRAAWRGGGELQRTAAKAGPQECQPEDAGRLSGVRPALRHIVRRRRGPARLGGQSGGAARSFRHRDSIPTVRPVAADRARASTARGTARRARDAAIEGMMLKRRDSPYVAGRRAGLWYKWKRDPLTADCV